MVEVFTSKSGYEYRHVGEHPLLGIRVGKGACQRAAEKNHSPRGAVMRLAADIAKLGARLTADSAGNVLPAPTTGDVKDPSKVRPTLFVEHIHSAERWYASHKRKPSQAEIAKLWAGQDLSEDEKDLVRSILVDTRTRTTTAGWQERHERKRQRAAERRTAKLAAQLAAKAK